MAKTIDITKLGNLSSTSVSLLGKSSSDKLGYIDNEVLKEIDQTFNSESKKAQSGTAVAEAIAPLATKEELDTKASKDELAKAGDSIAELQKEVAGKTVQELDGTKDGDKAKIQNQTDGAVIQYVSADGSNSAVTVNDGSQNVGAEICSLDQTGNGARVIVNKSGAFYSVGESVNVDKENEIATKKDLESKISITNNVDGNTSYMANEKDGGILKYITSNKDYSKITLGDAGAQGPMAQVVATDENTTTIAKIDVYKTGAYYAKKAGVSNVEANEIATKGDLAGYVPVTVTESGNTSYVANEKDGGILKYSKADESYAKFTLCDVDNAAVAQIVATNKEKTQFAKIDARKTGIYYAKKTGNPTADDELVVKKDLKNYIPVSNNVNGNTSYMANEKDGGILKYITSNKDYSKITLGDAGDNGPMAQVVATDEETTSIAKIDVYKTGAYYAKKAGASNDPDNEIATMADVNKKLDMETKGKLGNGVFSFTGGTSGATMKYIDNQRKLSGSVGVFDGNTNGILVELGAGPMTMAGPKIYLNTEKAVYCKGKLLISDDDEILTKKDIKDLTAKVAEIDTNDSRIEALENLTNKQANTIKQLETKLDELQKSYTEAISQVNDYTANVKTLLDQTSPSES